MINQPTVPTKKAIEMMKLTKRQIEVAMFACGAGTIQELRQDKLIVTNNTSSNMR